MAADLALSRNGAGPSDGDLGLAGLAISRNIVDHGLPPLGSRGASSSSAHYDSSRLPATVELGVLEVASGPPLVRQFARRLWNDVAENPRALDWGSEKDIQRCVVLALKDVLSAAGLGSTVSVQEDLTMFSVNSRQQKSDVYLVKQKMMPIGVIEVKKPTEDVFDTPQVNGQIYDYMMALRSFSGLRYVFGILTTYERWRVCWLEDADPLAQAKLLPGPVERRFQLWPYLPPAPRWLVGAKLPAQRTVTLPTAAPRAFHATKLYDCTDTALTAVLVSAVRKMERSPVTQPTTIDALLVGTGLLANAAILHWAQKSLSKVEFGVELTVEDKEFWLLADLYGGADGNVWLASTPRGKGCIVKFSRRSGDEAREACAREASIWTTVWRRNAFALQLGGNAAVVMPYVKPCAGSGDAFEPPAPLKAATKAAIATLSRHEKRHDDLKWSHVGKYLDASGREKVVLFDLAQVSENVQPEDAKRSMEEALGLAQG